MSSVCPNQGLKVRLGSSVKFKALARNLFKPKLRISGTSKLKAKMSVIYRGFPRGTGVVPDGFFGSSLFGFNPNDPSLYVKSMRCSGNVRINTTSIFIHRCVTDLSKIIFDIESEDYRKFGDSGVPPSVYVPQSSSNSTSAHSAGPQIIHSLSTERSREENCKFTARASVPINNFSAKFKIAGEINCKKFEKLNGYFDQINKIDDYVATDKLYPIRDIDTTNNGISLVNEKVETENIYQSINEGISVGNITKNGKSGLLVCDDSASFITPSSIYTEGEFFYKCEVTPPSITPLDTFLFIRASAPISNNDSDIPPEYNITNIRFEDPSGNLIAKYKDITVKGEQDHSKQEPHHQFITYVTEPEVNRAALNTWQIGYPVLGESQGYTLSMDIKGNCFYHAFEKDGFDNAFQDSCNLDDKFVPSSLSDHMAIDGTPLSTMSNDYNIRPTNALRISAIELANRGRGVGILRDNEIPLYLDVVNKGNRLTRTIYPTKVLSDEFTNDVYPTNTINVWRTSPDIDGNVYYSSDHDNKSQYELQDRLSNIYTQGHITLDNTTVPDSGKLQLLYEHKAPFSIKEQRGGSFNFGNKYQNGFNRSAIEKVFADDSFFIVEEIVLRVEARKAPNTPDFPIDVVGYSDDGLLVSTSQIGGFLQNAEIGTGNVPLVSGYTDNNDLGISSRAISNKNSYYEEPITSVDAGDHYKIDNSIMVNSTEFEIYDIPLKIYKDQVELGRSPDYSMSTYFESLYLDIYPIPSGASIANAGLVVKYQPAGALKMNTLGSPKETLIANRKNTLHPTARKAQDKVHNASITSLIENIPHAYETSESTLKTNYSRRWRGSSGLVSAGAFESAPFGFGFSFPQLDTAFILGRYDFRNVNGTNLQSINGGSVQGTFSNADTANSVVHSLGSRFISDSLFSNPVRPYKTLDWVPAGDVLENRIIDAFDYAVRVSGVDGHINFGDTPTSEGFSLFIRFSPDVTMSGVGYNLWDDGVLFQKQDSGQDLEYGLRYNNGKLEGFAREDSTGNTITVTDTVDFYDYQYPLSILLTYNADNNQKLKLYTENEIADSWTRLRDESQEFVLTSGTSDLTFGYSKDSGLGLNAFITEIGLAGVHPSGGANLVDVNPNSDYQQDSVDSLFDSHSVSFSESRDQNPLWQFVDEPTEDWRLGSFKYCQFGTDYDIMTKRVGKDYMYHTYVHDGLTYADRLDENLPASLAPALNLAYHSQVENDMVRFSLDGREERFYAIKPRIQKDLPRSYIAEDDALQINTVIQHESFGDVVWDNGETGAKIIVSLYTPAKESDLLPTKNYGLISRSTHYVSSEDCWTKLASRFTIADVKDTSSEPWAYFEQSITKQELKENYFAREIDEMFIQYDVVYPSGSYSQSDLVIHSLDISLYGALQEERTLSSQLSIYASGEAYSEGSFNLYADGYGANLSDMNLYSSGVAFIPSSGDMNLISSGTYQETNSLPFYSFTVGTVDSSNQGNFGSAMFGDDPVRGLPLSILSSLSFEESDLDFNISGTDSRIQTEFNELRLMLPDQQVGFANKSILDLYVYCDVPPPSTNQSEIAFDSMSMYTLGPDKTFTEVNTNLNLFIDHSSPEIPIDAQMPLYLYHKKPIGKEEGQLESFVWDSGNIGTAIDVVDNDFASIPANDELRGVNTVCYGGCDLDLALSCEEVNINTHDTVWYEPDCVDGGVIRGFKTYTNADVNAFGTNEPYDKQYYGIRKFQNLIPDAPYDIKITAKTGTDQILDVPRELKEWEYGTKNAATGDANEDIDYVGTKLTAPQPTIEEKQKFAKGLTVLGDRIALGCPFEDSTVGVTDLINPAAYPPSYPLIDNGKIYLYRKMPEPSGNDWSDQPDKSPFYLEQEIVLPTGFRRDDYYETTESFYDDNGDALPFNATIRNWVNVGEGRQLGSSLDSASTDVRDVIVAGGPGSSWSREFAPISTTPVKIALFLFNNELITNPEGRSWEEIRDELKNRDLLYKYFADPPVEFDIQIILLEPMLGADIPFVSSDDFNDPTPDFVTKYTINRHYDFDYNSPEYKAQEAVILQELIDIFHREFPIQNGLLHNGIPSLFSFYIDGSRSLGPKPIGYFDDGLRSGALNKFIEYYEDYSLNNGVTYYNGQAASGGTEVTVRNDEDWISQSIASIRAITDIDKLNANGNSQLVADNLGTFNSDASEFNNPPPSGGAVYIFENINDSDRPFELVQRFDSPVTYTDDVSDRFGHDVAISDDGNIVVVGSPYTNEAVQIWEYDKDHIDNLEDYAASSLLPNFLAKYASIEREQGTFGEAYVLNEQYLAEVALTTSVRNTRISYYYKMSESLKFTFSEEYNIKPYGLIKTISYDDLYRYTGGSWAKLYNKYIPTPRMGFSVDTNEDGSLVAIGCPTDSLGERDASITWFRYSASEGDLQPWQWHNYANAGAVRLLESRDYYPHDRKVVEYYKFGNLHELQSDPEDANFYEEALFQMFNSRGLEYSRTSFSEDKKIPEDAGMAMIITPSIDAASDEIINNIREWLALGDRNLVLVGNDPKWEANGIYEESNRIINYILGELDIKLRIYAARNTYDALIDDTNIYFNAQASFVPAKTTRAIGSPAKLHGFGAGDIRFYDPGKSDIYNCQLPPGTRVTVDGEVTTDTSDPFAVLEQIDNPDDQIRIKTYRELHNRCELPIAHEGDLRAKYWDQCVYRNCKGETTFNNFQHNLAYMYGTHTECNDWGCTVCDEFCPPIVPINFRDDSEPMPIVSAYESVVQTFFVEAVPPREVIETRIIGYDTETSVYRTIGDTPYSGIDFMWSATSGNYTDLDYNINATNSQSLWYDPEEFNAEDAILQAKSTLPFSDIERLYNILPSTNYVVSQTNATDFPDSPVFLVAGTLTESRQILLESGEGDKNLNLYFNMLAKDADGSSKVAQLGGFTNRANFTEGYVDSDLEFQMTSLGITFDTNVPVRDLNDVSKGYDVAWIANTDQYPSDEDIAEIKQFLSDNKFKKLVITYGQDPEITGVQNAGLTPHALKSAQVAEYICSELGLSMRPLFLPTKNKYATEEDIPRFSDAKYGIYPEVNTIIAEGYDEYSSMTQGTRTIPFIINIPPFNRKGQGTGYYHNIIPIDPRGGIVNASFPAAIEDLETIAKGRPELKTGIAKVTFDIPEPREDVPEDDTYNVFRLYFELSAQTAQEVADIDVYIPYSSPTLGGGLRDKSITDKTDSGDNTITTIPRAYFTSMRTNNNRTIELDLQLASSENKLEIYFHNDQNFGEPVEDPVRYLTSRLVSVSGVRLNTFDEVAVGKIPIYDNFYVTRPGQDAYSYDVDVVREISNDSDQYCIETGGEDNVCAERKPIGYGENIQSPPIADGPVLVAQDVYHQAGYFNGYNKSRVTVISDVSLIQGRTILTEDQQRVNEGVANLLSSLYPRTTFANENSGRDYESSFKIISPERGSPARLLTQYPDNSGLVHRWGNYQDGVVLDLEDFSDDEGKQQIIPTPPQTFVPQPLDPMIPLTSAEDTGTFRKYPDPPKLPPAFYFSIPPYTYQGLTREQFEQEWYVNQFEQHQQEMGVRTKLLDVVDGVSYEDAGLSQRIPDVLRETGSDHLDLEVFNSGYPGDLFGYKVTIHKDKVYVGSPFAVYRDEKDIISWDKVVENQGMYGTEVGYNGGAGAVYVVERTGVVGEGRGSVSLSSEKTTGIPWECTEKFRPEEISVGYSGITAEAASGIYGEHPYSDQYLAANAHVPDMFGYNIALDGDILAISAPGHNFESVFEKTPAEFMRKEFNEQFDITKLNPYSGEPEDLTNAIVSDTVSIPNSDEVYNMVSITPDGYEALDSYDDNTLYFLIDDTSVQDEDLYRPQDGRVVINNGAVFTYENRISDWGQKIQSWTQIHKLVPEGFNSRVQASGENTYFGKSLGLYRARRVDADYIIAAGSDSHKYSKTDGTVLESAGAAWTFDGMLRKLRPAFSHPDTYIEGRVYGQYQQPNQYTTFRLENGTSYDETTLFEGRIISTNKGEIFVEASGQDGGDRGYVVHRPYIEEIKGTFAFGQVSLASVPMFMEGYNIPASGDLPLFSLAPDQATVYNNIDLFTYNAVVNSEDMNLYSYGWYLFFGDQQVSSDILQDSEDVKELQEKIYNASNLAFLISRGGR